MKNKFIIPISLIFLSLVIFWTYFSQMPLDDSGKTIGLDEFSTARARQHVKEMSVAPHYIGSAGHVQVAGYVEKELRQLGLEVTKQDGFSLTEWGNLTYSKNIMARIPGSGKGKALLLLSHYDSAPHSNSKGAADDASGVAVILESIRAFLHNKTPHTNDIIILFTDAEELGLNGAAFFVKNHPWAKEVGLALNFEARGTSGPGYMLMEVTDGNAAMVDAFDAANPRYTVGNSLMYSIYKMLPNDTDLTVFREAGIQGFNFAFIDSHYNYHTQQDDESHLDMASLAHQGSYLVPLLKHFSEADLSRLGSDSDQVYFNTPIGFFHYSFGMNYVLCGIATLLLVLFVFLGMGKRILHLPKIGRGILVFLSAILICATIVFLLWKLLLWIYPEYNEIQQGFTYNGHYYILAFVLLSFAFCLFWYARCNSENRLGDYLVGPILIWIILCFALSAYLPGAGFFIIPVLFSILCLGHFMLTQKPSVLLYTLFSVPSIFLLVPLITMFPVGLGLKMLTGSAALLVLTFGLMLPLFGQFRFRVPAGIVLILASLGFFITAHVKSGFSAGEAKPNSLVFYYNADKDQSYWATYDETLDDWTQTYIGAEKQPASKFNLELFSKYGKSFTWQMDAMNRELSEPEISIEKDSIVGNFRQIQIRITPMRPVNRYDIFAPNALAIHNLRANGVKHIHQEGSLYKRKGRKLLSYYVVDNKPLLLQFQISAKSTFDMDLLESSFDLMENPGFSMKKRADWMMPKPFVLTDAIMIRKKIRKKGHVPAVRQLEENFIQRTQPADTIADPDQQIEETAVDSPRTNP